MTSAEQGFLLLCCELGDGLTPLSLHRLEQLRHRMETAKLDSTAASAHITVPDLQRLGYSEQEAAKLYALLSREEQLHTYLSIGAQKGCTPLTCVSDGFPQLLRKRLGAHCPAVLFYRGNLSLLQNRKVALVGSRQLSLEGGVFAAKVGQLAAAEGYTLVSGNARGADKTAQEACLRSGGSIIAVVSDALFSQPLSGDRVLYLSEGGWHQDFSAARALQRNRLIYALSEKSLVAQCTIGGGTWSGAQDALRKGISPVFISNDGSAGSAALISLGAVPVTSDALYTISALSPAQTDFI